MNNKYARPAPGFFPGTSAPKPVGPPVAPATPTGTAKPPVPGSATRNLASPIVPVVQEMQKAILHLADVASATDVTSMKGNQEGNQTGEQAMLGPEDKPQSRNLNTSEDPSRLKHLGGSDAFGKFILQNFIPKGGFISTQYLNTDVVGNAKRQNASMNPSNLRGIIDTMRRVGSPNIKGEHTVDGLWQTRTNNALHVVGDLTEAMCKFVNSMGLNKSVIGYSLDYLEYFRKLVPAAYTDLKSSEDIADRATKLLPHLNAITSFFESLNKNIINNPEIREYIDQKKSFDKYEQMVTPTTSAPENNILKGKIKWNTNPIENSINIKDLNSLDNFKKYIIRATGYEGNITENRVIKSYLDDLSKLLNGGNKPYAPTGI